MLVWTYTTLYPQKDSSAGGDPCNPPSGESPSKSSESSKESSSEEINREADEKKNVKLSEVWDLVLVIEQRLWCDTRKSMWILWSGPFGALRGPFYHDLV